MEEYRKQQIEHMQKRLAGMAPPARSKRCYKTQQTLQFKKVMDEMAAATRLRALRAQEEAAIKRAKLEKEEKKKRIDALRKLIAALKSKFAGSGDPGIEAQIAVLEAELLMLQMSL